MDMPNAPFSSRSSLKDVGDAGEKQACDYLTRKGYKLLAKKFQTKYGEIDLIMEDGPTLVFVEVKKRRDDQYGPPEEALTPIKKGHIIRSAMIYVKRVRTVERMIRFDVVTIDGAGIRHYEDAFMAGNEFYY